jgi:hypothetical protein
MSLILGNLVLNGKCHVMGILNVTPDSFYDGGKHFDLADVQDRVDSMVKEGLNQNVFHHHRNYLVLRLEFPSHGICHLVLNYLILNSFTDNKL